MPFAISVITASGSSGISIRGRADDVQLLGRDVEEPVEGLQQRFPCGHGE